MNMQTEQLLDMLARQSGPAPRAVVARRLWPAVIVGLLCSSVLTLGLMGPLPVAGWADSATWFKLGYALLLAVAAGVLTARLARPMAHLTLPRWLVVGVIALVLWIGAVTLSLTPAEARLDAILGETWRQCPWSVMAFSLPALAGYFAGRQRLGTHPTETGGVGQWMAGGSPRGDGLRAGLPGGLAHLCGCLVHRRHGADRLHRPMARADGLALVRRPDSRPGKPWWRWA